MTLRLARELRSALDLCQQLMAKSDPTPDLIRDLGALRQQLIVAGEELQLELMKNYTAQQKPQKTARLAGA